MGLFLCWLMQARNRRGRGLELGKRKVYDGGDAGKLGPGQSP